MVNVQVVSVCIDRRPVNNTQTNKQTQSKVRGHHRQFPDIYYPYFCEEESGNLLYAIGFSKFCKKNHQNKRLMDLDTQLKLVLFRMR